MPVLVLACHCGVLASVVWLTLTLGLGPLAASAALLVLAAPLVAGLKGLRAGSRYTAQWLAIAMVFYFGIGLAETVAAMGTSLAANALLLSGAAELALLLRFLKVAPTAPRESTES